MAKRYLASRSAGHKSRARVITMLLLAFAVSADAQVSDLRLPISLNADSTDYDGKTSMLLFRGLKLTQGPMGIEADEGRASKLDFEDSVWQFTGNVRIDVENGHIECDAADLKFTGHELQLATVTGQPAQFEMKRPDSNEITYAEAGRLQYDLSQGVVEFSGRAKITEGGNQLTSDFLVYNINEQRINAQSGKDGDPKVKIIYTPRETDLPDSLKDKVEVQAEDAAREIVELDESGTDDL